MLSTRFLESFGKILNFLSGTYTLLFDYDHKTCKMVVSSQKRQHLVLKWSKRVSVAYCVFSIYRLITEFNASLDSDYIGLTVLTVWILVYIWELTVHACHALKKTDMAWLYNQIVDLDVTFTKMSQSEKISVVPEGIIFVCVYMGFLAVLMWTTVYYFLATKKVYIYSIVPEEYQTPSVFFLFLVFEFYSKYQACCTVLWDLMFFEITTTVSCHWIQNILSMPKPIKLKVKDYKFLNVLSNYINASNSTVKFPLVVGVLFILICMGIYGAVRLVGQIDPQIYIMFLIIINNASLISALIWLTAAKQQNLSKRNFERIVYLKEISRGGNHLLPSKETKREIKCLQIFGVAFGIVKTVKYSHAAQFVMGVSNAALSLLVAFPNAK